MYFHERDCYLPVGPFGCKVDTCTSDYWWFVLETQGGQMEAVK